MFSHGTPLALRSLPSPGAWIETFVLQQFRKLSWSRSPHRERGLKQQHHGARSHHQRRSPHRERGLKRATRGGNLSRGRVAPLTGSVD